MIPLPVWWLGGMVVGVDLVSARHHTYPVLRENHRKPPLPQAEGELQKRSFVEAEGNPPAKKRTTTPSDG